MQATYTPSIKKKLPRQEQYIYEQFFVKNPTAGFTYDDIYQVINDNLKQRFDKLMEDWCHNDSVKISQIIDEIDRECDRRSNRKISVKRSLSNLRDKGLIYTNDDRREASNKTMCKIYFLKTQ